MDLGLETVAARLARTPPEAAPWFFERSAAVALILRYGPLGEAAPELLLMRRIERAGDPWSGHVSLPGGRGDPGDASARATAEREVREEVGVDMAAHGRLLGRLRPLRPLLQGLGRPLHVVPFVYHLSAPAEPRPGAEAVRVFWLPLAEVVAGRLDSTLRYGLAGLSRDFPCWRHDGEVVWGLTYRVVQDFLRTVGEPPSRQGDKG